MAPPGRTPGSGSGPRAAVLAAAGVRWDQVTGSSRLGGGTFNTVYLVRRAGGTGLVVKLAPDPAGPMLRYERGILSIEAMYYRLAGQLVGVAVPSGAAVDAGRGVVAGGYLVMSECAGRLWHLLRPPPGRREHDELRVEIGRQVAIVHTITGSGFGYPSAPLRPSWRAAFLEMADAVLADAAQFAVPLPRPAPQIRELLAAQAPVLDQVQTPVLVHFDLSDGNILVDMGQGAPRIGALIDAERAFWGDPLAEFVSLALFADIEQDPAFLHGYRKAGGTVAFDAAAWLRLSLYRAWTSGTWSSGHWPARSMSGRHAANGRTHDSSFTDAQRALRIRRSGRDRFLDVDAAMPRISGCSAYCYRPEFRGERRSRTTSGCRARAGPRTLH
jgi:aminoglycoside phosphotransferase (APT) family kinase protein